MDVIKFFLVMEKRRGDFNIINIKDLDIYDNSIINSLDTIDLFTSKYTLDELLESIKRSNTVQDEYLKGTLKIISDHNHFFRVLTKEVYDVILEFNNSLIIDKNILNKIYSIYKNNLEKSIKSKDVIDGYLYEFKNSLNINDFNKIFRLIDELPYINARMVYFSIYDTVKCN